MAVDFRVSVSESKESVYVSLDQEYERLNSQTPFIVGAKYTIPMKNYENFHSDGNSDNAIDNDGYTIVKEPGSNINEECHERVIQCCNDKLTLNNNHHQISQLSPINCDDSSGFVSAGFDLDKSDQSRFEFQPHMLHTDSEEGQVDQSRNVFDDTYNKEVWPEVIEPIVITDSKERTNETTGSERYNDCKKSVYDETSDSDSDFETNENTLCEFDSVEELCLTQEDSHDAFHYPSESDFLNSHYIFASGNATHL